MRLSRQVRTVVYIMCAKNHIASIKRALINRKLVFLFAEAGASVGNLKTNLIGVLYRRTYVPGLASLALIVSEI